MTSFNWRVMQPNTMRSYSQAVRDFETVVGRPVQEADVESVTAWDASMQARGLSVGTRRCRLSAVAIVTGVRIDLPKRAKTEGARTLSKNQVKALMATVSDPSDRMLLVKLLTLGTHARTTTTTPPTFAAHLVGETSTVEMTAQQVSRKLKHYAGKAGLNPEQISLRVWCLTGRRLVDLLNAKELVELVGHAEDPSPVDWRPLHGIGRRSGSRSMSV